MREVESTKTSKERRRCLVLRILTINVNSYISFSEILNPRSILVSYVNVSTHIKRVHLNPQGQSRGSENTILFTNVKIVCIIPVESVVRLVFLDKRGIASNCSNCQDICSSCA